LAQAVPGRHLLVRYVAKSTACFAFWRSGKESAVIDFSLSDALAEIQSRAREFAQSEILPIAAEYDRKAEVPLHILAMAT
jgi:hypothetical protein